MRTSNDRGLNAIKKVKNLKRILHRIKVYIVGICVVKLED